jgi:hypothetical protein
VFTGSDFNDEFGPRLAIAEDKTELLSPALNKATSLSIPGEDDVIFSLAGSSAALRFIDEVQGRATKRRWSRLNAISIDTDGPN